MRQARILEEILALPDDALLTSEDLAIWFGLPRTWIHQHSGDAGLSAAHTRREDGEVLALPEGGHYAVVEGNDTRGGVIRTVPSIAEALRKVARTMPRARRQNGWVRKTGTSGKKWVGYYYEYVITDGIEKRQKREMRTQKQNTRKMF